MELQHSAEQHQNNSVLFIDDVLYYIEPSIDYADEIAAFRQEMLDAESDFSGCYCLKRMENPMDFIRHCRNWSNPNLGPNASGAKGTVVLCIRKSDNRLIGCFQAHHILNERMLKYSGHIGYAVRPSERRKGFATKMLACAIQFLSKFGFKEVIVSCIPENEASMKTILANGGQYLETVFLEDDQVFLNRYRIQIHKN